MSRMLRVVYPLLIIALVVAAALGAWQLISGEEGSEDGSGLKPLEEVVGNDSVDHLTEPGARATADASDQSAVDTVQQFVDSGSSPCELPATDAAGHPWYQDQYSNLADLINDVDLVLVGQVTGWALEDVRIGTKASFIFAHVEIEEVLAGTVAGSSIDIDLGERVTAFGDVLRRHGIELDSCASGRLLLFANRLHGSGFSIGAAWVSLDTPDLERSTIVGVFDGFDNAGALLAAVRASVEALAAQDLPKGVLACQGKSSSQVFREPDGCPGDQLNLSQTFELSNVVEAKVTTTDPGLSSFPVDAVTHEADSPELAALLRALDFSVALEPLGPLPPDVIRVTLQVNVVGQAERSHRLVYSPLEGVIRLTDSQFVAPPALVQAMTRYLAA